VSRNCSLAGANARFAASMQQSRSPSSQLRMKVESKVTVIAGAAGSGRTAA